MHTEPIFARQLTKVYLFRHQLNWKTFFFPSLKTTFDLISFQEFISHQVKSVWRNKKKIFSTLQSVESFWSVGVGKFSISLYLLWYILINWKVQVYWRKWTWSSKRRKCCEFVVKNKFTARWHEQIDLLSCSYESTVSWQRHKKLN